MIKKYSKKPVYKKTFAKKKSANRRRTYSKNNSLVALIKKVSLKNSETKCTHVSQENNNINHNTGQIVTGLLNTSQGITDTGSGSLYISSRIGDEVVARGISFKLWIANKLDRPNIMYRLCVFKYSSQSIPTLASLFKGAVGNRIMDDLDKETFTPVYQKIFNLQVGYSAYATGTAGDADGREAHKYVKIWIPLKNKKLKYNDGGTIPKFINYGFFIVPYDSYGTLTTDNVASYAIEYKFYFKDP